jgi:hypothetical protein
MEKGVVKAFRKVKGLPGWQAFIFTFHVSFLVLPKLISCKIGHKLLKLYNFDNNRTKK